MLQVLLYPKGDRNGGKREFNFPDYCEPRVLASGALKIVRFAADPEVAEDGENFTEAPLVTVAVFNGDYAVRRVQNDNE